VPETVGVVPLEGRGPLPFLDLHREPLLVHAVRAMLAVDRLGDRSGDRVVVTVDRDQRAAAAAALAAHDLPVEVCEARTWWRADGPPTVLLHDPLCPLVPPSFLARCLEGGPTSVAVLPVTDTVKTVVDDHIVDTVDRETYRIVASPVVLHHPGGSAAPPTADFAALVAWLRAGDAVLLRQAPSLGRRVDDASAVVVLECLDEMARAGQQT
jgi:hypothetical protein